MSISFKATSLKVKIIGACVLSVVFSLGAVLIGVRAYSTQAVGERVRLALKSELTAAKTSLQKFHSERWRALDQLSESMGQQLEDGNGEFETLFSEFRRTEPYFSELLFTDVSGRVLVGTDSEVVGTRFVNKEVSRRIDSGESQALAGPFWDDRTESLDATTSKHHDGMTLLFGHSVHSGGEQVGLLYARMPADVNADLIGGPSSAHPRTGHAYLVALSARQGVPEAAALSRSRFEDVGPGGSDGLRSGMAFGEWGSAKISRASENELVYVDPESKSPTRAVAELIAGESFISSGREGYFDFRHSSVVGAGERVRLPGTSEPWGLVLEADANEAYTVLVGAERVALYCGLGAVLATFLLVGFTVVRPMNTLAALTERIRDTSAAIQGSSRALGRSASSLSDSATDQASAIAETMASMEEITAMVSSNNESAREALEFAQQNSRHASDGADVVADMGQAMSAISEQNSELASVVEIIENISEKTKVINDIVFETKLLSFNASIEAARAGEQGKGFAVVAEEVGNLARLSGKAAQEISALIEQSTKQVQTMVSVTRASIAEGVAVTDRAHKSFEDISEGVRRVSQMMDSIALSSSEQQQGIAQVSRAMAQMDTLTQNNAAAAGESAGQSAELRQSGEQLLGVVDELDGLVGAGSQGKLAPAAAAAAPQEVDVSTYATTADDALGVNDGAYNAEQAGLEEMPVFEEGTFG